MTQTRANKAAQAWRNCLAPTGGLSQDGTIAMSDLAKFCRIGSSPEVLDDQGRTDVFRTGKIVGLQEAYRRIEQLLEMRSGQSYALRMMAWPQSDDDA